MLEKGTTLAGYRIDGILGQGGMGVVYEATQLTLNRTVALKLLAAHLSDDIAFRERFRREGQIQAAIDHPNIITVHEAGETEEGLFIAMRLIRGPNLKEMIVARELDAGRTIRILRPVAEALDDAHGAGLIHRDVKPQNILVGARDHPYLADFGLTKGPGEKSLTRTGQFVGTLDYIAPEQIQGKRATARSDVYSLTAVFYECLTGIVSFPRESEAAVLYAHLSDPPPRVTDERPELPAGLDEVISQGMAKDPDERLTSCVELVEGAERAFTKRSRATMTPPGPIESPQQTGIREAEAEIPTREAQAPAETRASGSEVEEVNALAGETRAASDTSLGASVAAAPSAAPPRTLPRPTGLRPAQLAAAGAALAVLAVAGFLLGRSGGGSEAESLPNSASAGSLQIGFPADWERTRDNPAIPGIEFEDPIRLGTGDSAAQRLTTGAVDAAGPALLPPGFVRRLPNGKPPPRDDTVRLGKLEAFRYADLKPRGFDRDLTLYVVPTSAGIATVACIANRGEGASVGAACESAASSLELTRGRAYGLGPDVTYARRIDTTISRLNGQLRTGKAKLRSAKTPVGQARAAAGLAGAYAGAARRLARLDVSPAAEDIHATVIASLRRTAAAYTRISRAAGRGARSEYNAARVTARARERSVSRALDRLRTLGYKLKSQ